MRGSGKDLEISRGLTGLWEGLEKQDMLANGTLDQNILRYRGSFLMWKNIVIFIDNNSIIGAFPASEP